MKREIVSFHQDEHGDWVARLACGHTRHVRHRPPWNNRLWVTTQQGRDEWIGRELDCWICSPEP